MSQTQHPSWQEELMAYADGQLQAEQAEQVAAHLESCLECAQAVENTKRLSVQMTSWEVEEAPKRLSEAVLAELQSQVGSRRKAQHASGWWTRGRVLTYGFSGAAVLVLMIVSSMPSLLRSRQASPSMAVAQPSAEISWSQNKSATALESSASAQKQQQDSLRRLQEAEPAGPMVIRTIRLTLITKEFERARTRVEAIVRESKGYVDQLSVRTNPGSAKGLSAVLRFPADRLDAGLTELRKLGQAKEETQNTSDITGQYTDLVARLVNARNTEQRMLALQRERTGKLPEVVEVEREIARIREEIERMEAEQKNLSNNVQYATVHVELAEEYRAQVVPSAPSAGTRLRNAAVEGYEYATEAVLGIALSALMYGPTLLLWTLLLSVVGFLGWRVYQRAITKYPAWK